MVLTSQGCPDSWVGDSYCDRACKLPDCAMDGGDCGVEELVGVVPALTVATNNSIVAFDTKPSVVALYLNLSALLGPYDDVIDAVHDAPGAVRISLVNSEARVRPPCSMCPLCSIGGS